MEKKRFSTIPVKWEKKIKMVASPTVRLDVKLYCKGLVVYLIPVEKSSGAVVEATVALRHCIPIFLLSALRLEDNCGEGFRDGRQKDAVLMLKTSVCVYLIPENVSRGDVGQLDLKPRAVQNALFFWRTCFRMLCGLCPYIQLPKLSSNVSVEENTVSSQRFCTTHFVVMTKCFSITYTLILSFFSINCLFQLSFSSANPSVNTFNICKTNVWHWSVYLQE